MSLRQLADGQADLALESARADDLASLDPEAAHAQPRPIERRQFEKGPLGPSIDDLSLSEPQRHYSGTGQLELAGRGLKRELLVVQAGEQAGNLVAVFQPEQLRIAWFGADFCNESVGGGWIGRDIED